MAFFINLRVVVWTNYFFTVTHDFQNHLIHLGAKYAPCMRWDEVLDREVHEERLKERDTACCIRKDRAGCVQSPKTECSKVGDTVVTNNNNPPRSNWVSDDVLST